MNFDLLRTLRKECIQCMNYIHEMFSDGAEDTHRLIKIDDRVWDVYVSDYDKVYAVKILAFEKDEQIYEYRYAGGLNGLQLFNEIINAETEED